ncbi:uncharacterized protein LOC135397684 isoform X2 [Ornithodoros turicata]|uniref:uncharacterized protein LOC135397684 isoform X2 n=1 Tax=Ornithodoros turicata TaxID=34597 RepID=UPI0031386598
MFSPCLASQCCSCASVRCGLAVYAFVVIAINGSTALYMLHQDLLSLDIIFAISAILCVINVIMHVWLLVSVVLQVQSLFVVFQYYLLIHLVASVIILGFKINWSISQGVENSNTTTTTEAYLNETLSLMNETEVTTKSWEDTMVSEISDLLLIFMLGIDATNIVTDIVLFGFTHYYSLSVTDMATAPLKAATAVAATAAVPVTAIASVASLAVRRLTLQK